MCDQRERLMDYLFEEAAPAERRLVETHLEDCRDCRDEMRAFRRVREDLLAWEVPESSSVWTPFAPPVVLPWYRQVPAWAMAAAAGVMVVFGTIGGLAAQALGGRPQPTIEPPVARVVEPAPASVQRIEVRQSDEEVLSLVRAEIARLTPRSQPEGVTPTEAEALVARAARLQWEQVYKYLTTAAQERAFERRNHEVVLSGLSGQVKDLQDAVRMLQQQQFKGQQ